VAQNKSLFKEFNEMTNQHFAILRVSHLWLATLDVVQTILDGLSPACRSYLVLADKPTSYADLDYLCVQAANAEYADKFDWRFLSLEIVRRRLVDPRPPAVHLGHSLLLRVFIAIAKGI
jgi:hypothetical protein